MVLPTTEKEESIEWYFLCERCGKLFFSRNEFEDCPRCGHDCESHDFRIPPWQFARKATVMKIKGRSEHPCIICGETKHVREVVSETFSGPLCARHVIEKTDHPVPDSKKKKNGGANEKENDGATTTSATTAGS